MPDWNLVQEIYAAALPLPQARRQTFVEEQCSGDEALRDEINSLLIADDRMGRFLQDTVIDDCIAALAAEDANRSAASPAPIPASDLVGKEIAGRYGIVGSLRSGGFGEVYKAVDKKLHSRLVVIKVLQRHLVSEDVARREWTVRKFRQEIESLAKIKDAGVVGIFDADVLPDERPYIVMEFIEGGDLREFVKQQSVFEPGLELSRVAEIVRQVSRTLNASHDAGIIHRDLKPENIMVRQSAGGDLQVKVIDFGIAKVKDSLIASSTTSGHFIAGTWPYMAPEQLLGKKVDARSDIYSLGVITYELVTGRHPFAARNQFQLRFLHESGVKVKPGDLNPELPAPAQAVILKALEYQPGVRYQRVRDFGEDLAKALAGIEPGIPDPQPSLDRVSSAAASAQSERRVSRRYWFYALCALLLVAIGIAGVWSFNKPPTNEAPEQSLAFWLQVKMPKGNGTFDEFESTGEEAFKGGSKVYFSVAPAQPGYLYLINEGSGENNTRQWTAVFPNPVDNGGSSRLSANKTQAITGMELDKNPGDEIIHLVWAKDSVPELEALFQAESKDDDRGLFAKSEQVVVLSKFFREHPELSADRTISNGKEPRINIKGRKDLIVSSVIIKHRNY